VFQQPLAQKRTLPASEPAEKPKQDRASHQCYSDSGKQYPGGPEQLMPVL
jgi:hypothetical protein